MIKQIGRFRMLARRLNGLVLLVGLDALIVSEALSADIHGTIRDQTGGLIVAAKVSLLSTGGARRETVTNAAGGYAFRASDVGIMSSSPSIGISDSRKEGSSQEQPGGCASILSWRSSRARNQSM